MIDYTWYTGHKYLMKSIVVFHNWCSIYSLFLILIIKNQEKYFKKSSIILIKKYMNLNTEKLINGFNFFDIFNMTLILIVFFNLNFPLRLMII